VQFDERGIAQSETFCVGVWKRGTQDPIKQKARFKVRTGRCVFDAADAIPKAELLAVFHGRTEQPLEASPQVRSLADVRLRLRIVAAKKKYSWRCWNHGPDFSITGGHELEAGSQHKAILVRIQAAAEVLGLDGGGAQCEHF
jgi:hypothetical protein